MQCCCNGADDDRACMIDMIKVGKADKEQILRALADASHGAERLRRGKPAVTVKFEKLRDTSAVKVKAEPGGYARGTGHVRPANVEPVYDVLVEAPLYALSDANRVDVLRFGRHPDQDVQLLDIQVSREHGLVIFSENVPLFCDYGSLIDGKHAGTTNGTYLDNERPIRDAMIQWLPYQALYLGTSTTGPTGHPVFTFRITYDLHSPPDDDFGN
jgi:hypothetical protein